MYPAAKPSCLAAWEHHFGIELQIQDIKIVNHLLYDRKSFNFHWKCIHRDVFTESRLKKMKKSNGKCTVCTIDNENIPHLLYECPIIKPIWTKIEQLMYNLTGENVNINVQSILFSSMRTQQKCSNIFFNFLVYAAKWRIWKHRNNIKYGQARVKSSNDIFLDIVMDYKNQAEIVMNSCNFNKIGCKLQAYLRNIITWNE